MYNLSMNILNLPNYNLSKTLLGGQAFNWDFIDNSYYGYFEDKIIKLKELSSDTVEWQTFPEQDDFEFIYKYLNLEIDYSKVLLEINKDMHINSAISKVKNIRILKQDFSQTTLSFILSSHKNIKAVRKIVKDMSIKYGNKITVENRSFYTFPTALRISKLNENDLRNLGAGFRSKYLLNAAKSISNGDLTDKIGKLNADAARDHLTKLSGVGDKIADCILTFSLGFYNVTPIDIWALRVLSDLYNLNSKSKYSYLREWYSSYFGEYTAWAGQFLFEYVRENYKEIRTP